MSGKFQGVRVRTPSRLHFGLLSLPSGDGQPTHWPDLDGADTLPARHFGGVGLMIEAPGIDLTVRPASSWSAEGPLADRALAFARQWAAQAENTGPCRITIAQAAPEHAGLGTGTQLGLAVARALALAAELDLDPVTLARRVGRGRRSALGIHGFALGGFLVEGGKGSGTAIAPLVARVDFPETWKILMLVPHGGEGLHGARENQVFGQLPRPADLSASESLCRLVLLGMLPALGEGDLPAFSEALFDFNRRAGEWFRPWQKDQYTHSQTAAVVDFLRHLGVRGVGQSSWGPALFAVTQPDRADFLVAQLCQRFGLSQDEIRVTRANNCGARNDWL